HAETFGGDTAEEGFAAGGAIHDDVADEDVFLGLEGGHLGRVDDYAPARKALADEVVAIAFDFDGDAVREEGAQALAGRTVELDVHGVGGQTFGAVFLRDLVRQHGADDAVDVHHRQFDADF